MRKFFVGLIIGAVLSFAASAYADEVKSLVNKVVKGEVTVTVDGEPIADKGILVESKTYLPMRSVFESLGYEVVYTPGKVTLKKKTTNEDSKQNTESPKTGNQTEQPQQPVKQRTLNQVEFDIRNTVTFIYAQLAKIELGRDLGQTEEIFQEVAELKSKLAGYLAEFAQLETDPARVQQFQQDFAKIEALIAEQQAKVEALQNQ